MAKKKAQKRNLFQTPSAAILKELKKAEKALAIPITPPSFQLGEPRQGRGQINPKRNDNNIVNRMLHGVEVYHSPRNRSRMLIINPITPDKERIMKGRKRKTLDEFLSKPLSEG